MPMAMGESRRVRFDSTSSLNESDLLLPPNPESVPKDRQPTPAYLLLSNLKIKTVKTPSLYSLLRLNFVYGIFYLLGIGTLLPWNFFSNAKDYFMYKLRNTTACDVPYNETQPSTELQIMFESYLSIAAMLPGVLFMFLNTVATKMVSLKLRMVSAAIVMIAMFGVTIILVRIDTDSWQINFFAVTLVTIVIMNAGSAVLQGGIFGLSGMFPPRYVQAVMGGMGMGGTLASVANVLAIAVAKTALDQGFGYFLTALIVVIIALIGYLYLPLLKFARYHTNRTSKCTRHVTEGTVDVMVNEQQEPYTNDALDTVIRRPRIHLSLWSIFSKLWMPAFCVFITFGVTLSCYPAVASAIKSSASPESEWSKKYFVPVMCFVCFNIWDLFGRTMAGVVQFPREGSILLPIFCVSRIGFIPLFLLCAVEPRHMLPIVFVHDAYPIVFMSLFAVTNGYLGTLAMMYGPRRVPLEDIETGGSMMSFFLSLGLGVGSLFSLLLVKLT